MVQSSETAGCGVWRDRAKKKIKSARTHRHGQQRGDCGGGERVGWRW